MSIDRRNVLTALSLLPLAALSWPAAAQEITVRGITLRLTDRDKAWLKRHCVNRGFAEGSPQYQECYEDKAREILEQRARDVIYRPSTP